MSDKYVIYYLQTRAWSTDMFGSGGPLACLVMFKQTCWELWSLLHMAHWHVYILFDRLTCRMTCQVKQMIGIVSWAKVPWQKLQDKSGVNKLFWNVMVGITRSKVIQSHETLRISARPSRPSQHTPLVSGLGESGPYQGGLALHIVHGGYRLSSNQIHTSGVQNCGFDEKSRG